MNKTDVFVLVDKYFSDIGYSISVEPIAAGRELMRVEVGDDIVFKPAFSDGKLGGIKSGYLSSYKDGLLVSRLAQELGFIGKMDYYTGESVIISYTKLM